MGWRRLGAALCSVALAFQAAPWAVAAPGPTSAETPHVREVDPFIGTAGDGNTFPGAAAPFGMLQWSPDTADAAGGYRFGDHAIQGFSLTHLSGAGCAAFQDLPILPTVRPVTDSPGTHWGLFNAEFSHASETASPGQYGVRLEPAGIQVDLTTTQRTGLGRFRFPPTATASVLFNASGSVPTVSAAAVQVLSTDTLAGWVTAGGFCGADNTYTLYFVAQFNRPFVSFGTWTDGDLGPGMRSALSTDVNDGGSQVGAYVTFDTSRDAEVLLKVGVSYVSVDNALGNLQRDNAGWDVRAQQAAAAAGWEAYLGRIEVEGGTAEQRRTFYTALYHALLHPNVFSDANGEYAGFDNQVHTAQGYVQYANFSGWDIYRSEVPLLAWLAPRETSEMLRSLVADAEQAGGPPRWPLANDETGVMVGDPSALIIADGYAFGATDFDMRAAFEALHLAADAAGTWVRNYETRPGLRAYLERGYIPLGTPGVLGPATTTLEYASADFALARLAEALEDPAGRARYMARAQSWQRLFNARTGFVHPRTTSGVFVPGFEPDAGLPSPRGEQLGFLEGDTWQYTWMVPFNVRALLLAEGGPAEAIQRLDAFFDELNAGPNRPHAWMGNEPSFGVPWLYAFAGAPWRTQGVVRQIVNDIFGATPHGLPGNDDLGATSAWYVWAALGLYPAIPGVGGLVIGSPLFPAVTVHTGHGQRLRIVGQGAAADRPYVRGLQVNGQAYRRSWLPLGALAGDAPGLSFVLGSAADPSWGSAEEDLPPSFGEDQVPALGFSAVDELTLWPGESQAFVFGVRNVTDEPRRVQWQVEAPDGLAVEPSRGTLEVDAGGGVGTVELTVGAADALAPGCAPLLVALQSEAEGTAWPGVVLAVNVPAPAGGADAGLACG